MESITDTVPDKVDLTEIQEKVEQVLLALNAVKFKSPAITNEIDKYKELQSQITSEPQKFDQNRIDDILQRADKIIQSYSGKNTEYRIQTQVELKKGVLKYQFLKSDDIVNTSLQNSSELSKQQIEAFQDTSYDGTLHNHGKHSQFANYIGGKWVHDFYYTEGNIYAKLGQLEKDFIDKYAVGGTENQYEKQKALLESVLPKTKSLDEIFISPNHEFIHQFDLGYVEKISGILRQDKQSRQWCHTILLISLKILSEHYPVRLLLVLQHGKSEVL